MLAASNIDDKVVVLPMLMLMMDVAGVREEVGDMGSGGSENVGVGGIGMDGGSFLPTLRRVPARACL